MSLKKYLNSRFLDFAKNFTNPLKTCFASETQKFQNHKNADKKSGIFTSILMNSPWGGPWGNNPSGNNSSSGKSGNGNKDESGKKSSGDSSDPKKDEQDQGQKPKTDEKSDSNKEKKIDESSNKNDKQKYFQRKDLSPDENSDFFDLFKKFSQKLNNFFDKNNSKNSDDTLSKSSIGAIILGVILFWLSLGFYKVDTEENAVTLYFGKFYKIAQPGLNYHIPYPFGQVIKKSVITVNTEEFGFSSVLSKKNDKDFSAESIMLTGDENIVDVQFQVQWQISDIRDFVFNIAQPHESIRKSAESVMREIIAQTPIVEALSDGKQGIEQKTKILLQETLDSYNAGVRVVMVQLRRVDPPEQVINAFRDVQTAKADKEKEINEAQAYANDIIPRARGMASQMKEESEAYAKQVVANAQGEAARFLSVYNQYVKAKQVTKRRIYLETMEKIYRDMDKIYIDKGASKSFFGQLPMSDLGKNSESSAQENKTSPRK